MQRKNLTEIIQELKWLYTKAFAEKYNPCYDDYVNNKARMIKTGAVLAWAEENGKKILV